jgi:hypothetical protein
MNTTNNNRPTRILYRADDHRFALHMIARTGDQLAWRAYMKRVHGGWMQTLPNGREVLRGGC